ncbi:MAG TPA: YHYH protein [Patescibacteria group bacterium]
MKKKTKKISAKKHGKYFCKISLRWIVFLSLITLLAISNLLARQYEPPKVLGLSTTIYKNCSFWDIFCPLVNMFSRFEVETPQNNSSSTSSDISGWTGDLTQIPLGDGKYSSSPQKGYIYSCVTNFTGGGAEHAGNWINGNFWDKTQKISVLGDVSWPNATFSITTSGTSRIITGNGLPVNYTTGIFPISSSDPAYQYDRNPNSIKSQNITLTLPINPQTASTPTCVGMGMIGVAIDGVAIFNGLDESGRDAVAHEVQDKCDGHPQSSGMYHYHGPSDCLPETKENNTLVGYALDGYGIYSMYDSAGKEYTNSDLDECHGITSEVMWNGQMQNVYHYVMTDEYPYTIGCFRGSQVIKMSSNQNMRVGAGASGMPNFQQSGRPPRPPFQPPQ